MMRTHVIAAEDKSGTGWAPWWCLAVGAAALPFTQLQTVMAFAAWLAPIFLLRFARITPVVVWLPVLALVSYAAASIALRGIFPLPVLVTVGLSGLLGLVPYVVDRLLVRRLSTAAGTLVFPSASVALEWVASHSGLGTLGSVVYSQSDVLALEQLVSVTGIGGILFVTVVREFSQVIATLGSAQ